MGRFSGKVAFITGAGRGQGRNHAIAIAREGADVALVDLGSAGRVEAPAYRTATSEDLHETKRLVENEGVRALAFEADVRDFDALKAAADETAHQFGGIDYVVANAGISDGFFPIWDLPLSNWQTMIDINLSGPFYTCKATVPHVRARGEGGSIVLIGSIAAIKAYGWMTHYTAAKAGVRGLAVALAKELAPEYIRVNSLHPGAIHTDMTEAMVYLGDKTLDELLHQFREQQLLGRNIEKRDSTAALLWLLSDDSRFMTGQEFIIDGGESKK